MYTTLGQRLLKYGFLSNCSGVTSGILVLVISLTQLHDLEFCDCMSGIDPVIYRAKLTGYVICSRRDYFVTTSSYEMICGIRFDRVHAK